MEIGQILLLSRGVLWYNWGMKNFGTGPTLRDASPWLQNATERHAGILDVAERNSVIEGLPPLQAETRRRLMAQLAAMSGSEPPETPAK